MVHYKYYPNVESVPEYVSQGQMNQAKSWARIKMANVMIATTIGMCLLTVIWAKSLARENSLVEENFRRHMKFKKSDEDASQSSRMGLLTNTKKLKGIIFGQDFPNQPRNYCIPTYVRNTLMKLLITGPSIHAPYTVVLKALPTGNGYVVGPTISSTI